MTNDIDFLAQLELIIRDRIENPSDDSYTSQLVEAGDKRLAQKVAEEAVELAIAATAGDAGEQLDEAADLAFHLLVLLQAKGHSLADVAERLRQRHRPAKSS